MEYPIYLSLPAVVTCAGLGIDALWNAVTSASQAGLKERCAINGKKFFVGEIDKKLLKDKEGDRIHKIADCALSLIENDVKSAVKKYGKNRVALCVGSCDNGSDASLAAHAHLVKEGKMPEGYTLKAQGASEIASYISSRLEIGGVSLSFATACSSSSTAMMRGSEMLLFGNADAVVAGGIDIASDIAILGFDSLEAISKEKSNPFSKNRSGITIGEGAAFFIMTREKGKGENIALIGIGESSDAHHITSPDAMGNWAAKAISSAIEDAHISIDDIDYVNLHGTGTRQNDAMEAAAMQKVFGERGILCSSTKSITGHTLGAAGAIEAAVCYAAIMKNSGKKNAVLPVQAWDEKEDDTIPRLRFVDRNSVYNLPKVCMTNTFAFGGLNASMIIAKA